MYETPIEEAANLCPKSMIRKHMSQKPVTLRRENRPQSQCVKPRGLWYSIGDEWKDWVKGEMPHWLGEHEYEVVLHDSNILVLDTPKKILEFGREYRIGESIDWPRLAKTHDGIEISPYQWSLRLNLLWYYGWDVASGCIWNTEKLQIIAIS